MTKQNYPFSVAPVTLEAPTLGVLAGPAIAATDEEAGSASGGLTLCISGAGYRAALFHLGALTRFNELGLLTRLDTVGAMGGSAILAAVLAARVPWPFHVPVAEWAETVAEPMRAIAARDTIPSGSVDAAMRERHGGELVKLLGGELPQRPRYVFGAAGLAMGAMAFDDRAGSVTWEIGETVGWPGYDAALVADVITAVRTDLDAFVESEQAVLENHGYLLADAALQKCGLVAAGARPAEAPFPTWMDEARVRVALAASSRRTRLGRIRP